MTMFDFLPETSDAETAASKEFSDKKTALRKKKEAAYVSAGCDHATWMAIPSGDKDAFDRHDAARSAISREFAPRLDRLSEERDAKIEAARNAAKV